MPKSAHAFVSTESLLYLTLAITGLFVLLFPFSISHLYTFSTFTASKWCGLGIFLFALSELYSVVNDTANNTAPRGASWRLVVSFCGLFGYSISLFFTSYYIATGIFMLLSFYFLSGKQALLRGGCITICWLLLVYTVFEKLFSISLPVAV